MRQRAQTFDKFALKSYKGPNETRMTRPGRIVLTSIGLTIVLAVSIPYFIRAAKIARKNGCLNNLRQIESASFSYCLANRHSLGHTFTPQQFKEICTYVRKGKPPVCPVCRLPCEPAPYSVYEGPTCPCGQRLQDFDAPGKPWEGNFREYIAALQKDFHPVGMRLGSPALNSLTPQMFESVVVRKLILDNLEQWYKEPWDTDLIACAAGALGNIKDKRATETLIKGLQCKEWYARKRIAEALGKIEDKRAIEPLKALLEDKDERVKKAASDALKKLQTGV